MTTWGAWTSDGRLRSGLALSYSPTTISHSTSSVTVYWTLYGESKYASNESGSTATPWAISGSHSQSGYGGGWNVGSYGTWVVASGSFTVNTSYTSTVTVSLSGHFTSSYAYPGDTAYVSASISIPKRPIAAPSSPTSCNWSRTSDTHHTVTWVNVSPTDSSKPYQATHVQRQTDGGSWVTIANLGVVTSYADYGTSANHSYRYRVYASNTAGNSGYSYSGTFYTTPSPPTSVTATKTATGDITVTWTDQSPYNDTFALWHAADGVWDGAALTTSIANGTGSYTHTAPNPAQTHEYRMTSHVATPSLTSAYSTTSNTVQLEAPPNAPTSLAPSGTVVDGANDIVLTWLHNSVDTTAQTKYEVQYQVDGGAFTSMGQVTSTASTATVTAGSWGANGHTIGWQVRTWGADATGGSDGTGASPWSATASVTLSSTPTAAVNAPTGARSVDDGATTSGSTTVMSATINFTSDDIGMPISGAGIPTGATIVTVTDSATVTISAAATATATGVTITVDDQVVVASLAVAWGYAQAEGSPQSQWRVKLYDATGATVLETQTGTTETSTTMATQLSDATTYQVGVAVQSAAGLWSTEDIVTFDVAYALPPLPTITGLWVASSGAVAVTVDCPDPVSPEVPADHLQVWRFDGYDAWVLIADNVAVGSTVTDNIPALRATNTYAVVAVSATPSLNGTTELRRNYATNPAYRTTVAAVENRRNLLSLGLPTGVAPVNGTWTGPTLTLSTEDRDFTRLTVASTSGTATGGGFAFGSSGADTLPVVAGKTYSARVFARWSMGGSGTAYALLRWYDGTGTQVGDNSAATPNYTMTAGVWQEFDIVDVTAPAGATRGFITVYHVSGGAGWTVGDTFDVSYPQMELGPTALPYFDGSRDDAPDGLTYAWTGTINASASTATPTFGSLSAGALGYQRVTWQVPGAATDGTDVAACYLGACTSTTAPNPLLVFSQDAPAAAAGDIVKGRLRMRVLGATADQVITPKLFAYTSGGSGLSAISTGANVTLPMDGSWVDVVIPAGVCPASTGQARFYINSVGSIRTEAIVQVSNQLIEKATVVGELPGTYFDGSSFSDTRHLYTWSGTADASASIDTGKIMVDVDTTPGCHHVWVNAGPGFAQRVCFTTNVDISDDDGIEKALNQFAGRTKPVETMGEQTQQIITLRATKYDPMVASSVAAETSSLDDIAALSKLAAPACIRTPDGMRVFVSTGVPSFGGLGTAKVRTIAWTFVETDYTEPKGS
jgi:hypothetical protein